MVYFLAPAVTEHEWEVCVQDYRGAQKLLRLLTTCYA